jgi:hypothetical protein
MRAGTPGKITEGFAVSTLQYFERPYREIRPFYLWVFSGIFMGIGSYIDYLWVFMGTFMGI